MAGWGEQITGCLLWVFWWKIILPHTLPSWANLGMHVASILKKIDLVVEGSTLNYIPVLQCSANCGPGTRERYVSCRGSDGSSVDDEACQHLARPAAQEYCVLQPCGQWRTGDWTVVSNYPQTGHDGPDYQIMQICRIFLWWNVFENWIFKITLVFTSPMK